MLIYKYETRKHEGSNKIVKRTKTECEEIYWICGEVHNVMRATNTNANINKQRNPSPNVMTDRN